MRKKIVWWIYVIYILVVGITGFGNYDMQTSRTLADIALKQPVIKADDSVFDFTGDDMPNHQIVYYNPNIGGIMTYVIAGGIIAVLLTTQKTRKAGD